MRVHKIRMMLQQHGGDLARQTRPRARRLVRAQQRYVEIVHVRRHYNPHDLVLTLDTEGRPRAVPAAPGVLSEPGLVVYRFEVGLFYANAARFGRRTR